MRSAVLLLGLCLVGFAGLAIYSATQDDTLAFTLGVPSNGAVAPLKAGQTVCQAPIEVPDDAAAFDRVVAHLGTYGRPGPAVELSVQTSDRRTIARGRIAGGYGDNSRPPIELGRVTDRGPLRVCLRNAGRGPVGVYGAADAAARASTAMLDGQPIRADLDLVFERDHARSVASLVPAILSRASLFRASWLGSWAYVLLGLVVLLGVPALLAIALRDAQTGE
jgi:hypothetical protein